MSNNLSNNLSTHSNTQALGLPELNSVQLRVLSFSLFLLGACGIAYEYTLSKIVSDILGHSSKQWAITIAVMMFFMGVGSELQKHISTAKVSRRFFQLEVLLAIVGGLSPLVLMFVFAWIPEYFAGVHMLLISSIGLAIGLEIPLLARLRESSESSLQANIGRVLLMDYFGSLIGALAWVFVLPKFFTMIEMAAFLGLLNLGVAVLTWAIFKYKLHNRITEALGILLTLGLLIGTLTLGQEWASHAEQRLYQDRIIHTQTSKIQHIVLTESQNDYIALYLNGHLQFHEFDEHIYHEILVHSVMAAHPKARNILVMGGGDGLAVREVLKYPQVEKVTLVDLDSGVTQLARTHPELVRLNQGSLSSPKLSILSHMPQLQEQIPLSQSAHKSTLKGVYQSEAQVHLYHLDAHRFVQLVPEKYDVIIMDFPDPHHVELAKLYSVEFYQLLRDRLLPGGLMIQQSSSPSFAQKAFLSIGESMRQAGLQATPIQHQVPTFGPWGWWIAQEISSQDIQERQLNLPSGLKYLHPKLWQSLFIFGQGQLDIPVESSSLSSPRIVNYYLEGWFR